jgi:hypothetical protein
LAGVNNQTKNAKGMIMGGKIYKQPVSFL